MHGEEFFRKETPNFRVVALAFAEDMPVDVDDDGECAEQVANGELLHFRVETRVIHKPTGLTLGTDHLGGCLYRTLEDFVDYRECARYTRELRSNAVCGSYLHNMVSSAIREAKETLGKLRV